MVTIVEAALLATVALLAAWSGYASAKWSTEFRLLLGEVRRGYRKTLQCDRRHLLEDFRLSHVARKVVGVGSVGTRAWILMLFGRDDSDPLLLQAKEAQQSVLQEFIGPSRHDSNAERVVHGQHLMQANSDIFLGWHRVDAPDGVQRDFYVRQLRDWKGAVVVETMKPAGMGFYGQICGRTLARAHARSGDRVAIASYLSAAATPSTARSQSSPRTTPTRTNATTTRWWPPNAAAASTSSEGSD